MVIGTGFNNYMGAVNAINPIGNPYTMGAMGMMNPMMMGSHLNFKDSNDMKSFYNSKLDDAQAGMYANGQGRISQKAYMIASQLQGALASENETEAGNILRSLEGDKYELAGVELAYDQMVGSRCGLRNDLRHGLEGSKAFEGIAGFVHHIKNSILKPLGYNPMSQREAFDILNEGASVNTTVAANALKESTLGFGTDERTLEDVLASSQGRMAEINSSYQQMGCSLSDDIRGDYNAIVDGFGKEERLTGSVINELV
jgi:hypothetical protein